MELDLSDAHFDTKAISPREIEEALEDPKDGHGAGKGLQSESQGAFKEDSPGGNSI